MASIQSEVRALLESWSEAARIRTLIDSCHFILPTLFISTLYTNTPDLLRSGGISCGSLMTSRAQSAWKSAT